MLRNYQQNILNKLIDSNKNDLVQLDTGGGKTHIIAALCKSANNFIVVAHRNVLITQISKTLAKFDIKHNTISTMYTRRRCVLEHRKLGKELVSESIKNKFVASIDSIIAKHRRDMFNIDTSTEYLIIVDEAHHVTNDNKWGKLKFIFPNARILGFTATPCRLDGKTLHSASGGIFDSLIQDDQLKSDSVKSLINKGFLSDFKVFTVPSNFDYKLLKLGKNNDYTQQSLDCAIAYSTIVGDAVKHYKKLANNKQAVVMCVSIKNAEKVAEKFKESSVSAACVSSNMSSVEVSRILELFTLNQIKVLCNVDIVGEGFDVPNIECLIMLRKTNSMVLYRQWVGRSLRPLDNKKYAVIIDHVANVFNHGMPDQNIIWDIKYPPDCNKKTNLIACKNCNFTFYCWLTHCSNCGNENDFKKGAALCGFYVDLRIVDVNLCEQVREKNEQKLKLVELERLKKSELIPFDEFSNDAIGKVCNKLRKTAAEIISEEFGFEAANNFMQDEKINNSTDFWVSNFVKSDAENTVRDKFLRVYKKWLKSK